MNDRLSKRTAQSSIAISEPLASRLTNEDASRRKFSLTVTGLSSLHGGNSRRPKPRSFHRHKLKSSPNHVTTRAHSSSLKTACRRYNSAFQIVSVFSGHEIHLRSHRGKSPQISVPGHSARNVGRKKSSFSIEISSAAFEVVKISRDAPISLSRDA